MNIIYEHRILSFITVYAGLKNEGDRMDDSEARKLTISKYEDIEISKQIFHSLGKSKKMAF